MIEVMITVAIMGIAAAIILPALGNNDRTYVGAGVSMMIGDFDFAQTMAISDPSDQTVVKFDPSRSRWWVAPASDPDTPYEKLYSSDPYDTTMGEGRAYIAEDVTFTLEDITGSLITYNAFGQLEQEMNPKIKLRYKTASATIEIDTETGFLEVY